MLRILCGLFSIFLINMIYAENILPPAITKPIPIAEISNYPNYPKVVKELIIKAHELTQKNLTYLYGSADPKNGGMDCSGTIYYLLSTQLKNVPRASNEMYTWAEQKGKLYRVHQQDFTAAEFSNLKPGDLLFWSGTYKVNRHSPITHVMLYLGKNKKGEPLMFGASDGRTYQGKKMWGVSVFDFKLPNDRSTARFVGFSCIPDLTCKT